FELSPWPRKSANTTVNRSATTGATRCHCTSVCGQPWRKSTGGPEPAQATLIVAPEVSIESRSKPSNTKPTLPRLHTANDGDLEPGGLDAALSGLRLWRSRGPLRAGPPRGHAPSSSDGNPPRHL